MTNTGLTVGGDDRWHVVSDSGDWYDEMLRIGPTVWSRWSESEAELADAEWDEHPWSDFAEQFEVEDLAEMYESFEDLDEGVGMVAGFGPEAALGGFFLGVGSDPLAVKELVTRATEPVVERKDGSGLVLRATVPADPRLVEVLGDLPDVVVVIHLDRRDVPTRIVASSKDDDATEEIDIALRDVGAAIELEAPSADHVDPTPWIEEEALRAMDDVTPVFATDLPDGFVLQSASVETDPEISTYGCGDLWLEYGEPMPDDVDLTSVDPASFEDIGYLSLHVVPASCAVKDDASPFDETVGGRPSRSSGMYMLEVQVGDVVVMVDTTLEDAQLEALVAGLQPTTMQAVIDAIDAEAGAAWFSEG